MNGFGGIHLPFQVKHKINMLIQTRLRSQNLNIWTKCSYTSKCIYYFFEYLHFITTHSNTFKYVYIIYHNQCARRRGVCFEPYIQTHIYVIYLKLLQIFNANIISLSIAYHKKRFCLLLQYFTFLYSKLSFFNDCTEATSDNSNK